MKVFVVLTVKIWGIFDIGGKTDPPDIINMEGLTYLIIFLLHRIILQGLNKMKIMNPYSFNSFLFSVWVGEGGDCFPPISLLNMNPTEK